MQNYPDKVKLTSELFSDSLSPSAIDLVTSIFQELLQLPSASRVDIPLNNSALSIPIEFFLSDLYCILIHLTASPLQVFDAYETVISQLIDTEERKKQWIK